MLEQSIDKVPFFSYESFHVHGDVTNVISTRRGGKGSGAYGSLNVSFRVGDREETVRANRGRIAKLLGFDPTRLVTAKQKHGTHVAVVRERDIGRGALDWDGAFAGTDALVTDLADVPLGILIADCVALSFYDTERKVIAIAHGGWRGTLARIGEKTVDKMVNTFGSKRSRIVAGLSPSIGRCHYEVGEEVYDAFRSEFGRAAEPFFAEDMDGTLYLDLWAANESQLVEAGIEADQIEVAGLCTACHDDLFYSHRREDGTTGRVAAIIMRHGRTERQY